MAKPGSIRLNLVDSNKLFSNCLSTLNQETMGKLSFMLKQQFSDKGAHWQHDMKACTIYLVL